MNEEVLYSQFDQLELGTEVFATDITILHGCENIQYAPL